MEEYYLNNSKCCAKLPTRSSDYLQQSNFLSEFGTKDDKQEARNNLGVTELLNELKSLIDNKIIEYGGVAWDLKPTQGHTDRVLSSDALYKTLSDYATEKGLNSKITSLWSVFLNKLDDLEQRVNSVTQNGVALTNNFGDSETIGVSQKALTRVVNDLYSKLAECGCFSGMGIIMTVDPQFFISQSADVNITVLPSAGRFEEIKVYLKDGDNDEIQVMNLALQDDGSYQTAEPIRITNTTRVRAVGRILGLEYTDTKYIMKKKAFYIGSGTTYNEVINNINNFQEYNSSNIYTVTVNRENDRIFVILDREDSQNIRMLEAMGSGQPAIKMNGFVIPMTKSDIQIEDNYLTIFTSKNKYHIGSYPIEIEYNNE